MINFYEQQEKIIDYIKRYYPPELGNYELAPPEFCLEYIDLDKYPNKFVCFISFDKIDFPTMAPLEDDCQFDLQRLQMSVFLVFRQDNVKSLREKLQNATWAFYHMIKRYDKFSIAHWVSVKDINFYNYVEGQKYIVASQINMELLIYL